MYALENDKMQKKARKTIDTFLTRQGYTIREHNWTCDAGSIDIIATDDDNGDTVFIETNVVDGAENGFTPEHPNRATFEKVAAHYLADTNAPEGIVRFDIISMMVVNEGRGFLRHHKSCFASPEV